MLVTSSVLENYHFWFLNHIKYMNNYFFSLFMWLVKCIPVSWMSINSKYVKKRGEESNFLRGINQQANCKVTWLRTP